MQHKDEYLDGMFGALNDFKDNWEARKFIISCMEGNNDKLLTKAQTTIAMWAYSGISALRKDNLFELIRLENKNAATFKPAVVQLKKILFSKPK